MKKSSTKTARASTRAAKPAKSSPSGMKKKAARTSSLPLAGILVVIVIIASLAATLFGMRQSQELRGDAAAAKANRAVGLQKVKCSGGTTCMSESNCAAKNGFAGANCGTGTVCCALTYMCEGGKKPGECLTKSGKTFLCEENGNLKQVNGACPGAGGMTRGLGSTVDNE